MPHGLLEDRRVGGNAGEAVALDQLLQFTFGEELAADEIEPDRLALLRQLFEWIAHVALP